MECDTWCHTVLSFCQSSLVLFLNLFAGLLLASPPPLICFYLLQRRAHLLSRTSHMWTLSVSAPFHLLCLSLQPLFHLLSLQFTTQPCLTTAVICMLQHSNKNVKTVTPESHLMPGKRFAVWQRSREGRWEGKREEKRWRERLEVIINRSNSTSILFILSVCLVADSHSCGMPVLHLH